LDFIATLGNVKAFLLSICGAVVFTHCSYAPTPWRCPSRTYPGSRGSANARLHSSKILVMLLESVTLSLMGNSRRAARDACNEVAR
jgi:hypothetical protein